MSIGRRREAAAPIVATRDIPRRRALPNNGRILSKDKSVTTFCAPGSEWQEGVDEDGNSFWLNEESAEIVWVKPTEARLPYGLEDNLCCHTGKWQRFRCSREGRPFYVHTLSGDKSWAPPPATSARALKALSRAGEVAAHHILTVPTWVVLKPFLDCLGQSSLVSPVMPGCDGKGMPLPSDLAAGRSETFRRLFRLAQGDLRGEFKVEVITSEGDGHFNGQAPDLGHVAAMANLLAPEVDVYPPEFFRAGGFKSVIVAGGLRYGDQARVGTCDYTTGTLWIDSKPRQAPYLRSVFHHELFHLVDHIMETARRRQGDGSRGDPEWDALNAKGFSYGSGGDKMQHDHKSGVLGTADVPGFLNRYSTSAGKEDRAEVYAALVCNPASLRGDPILEAKGALLMRRIKALCPAMGRRWFDARADAAERRRREMISSLAPKEPPPPEKEIAIEIEQERIDAARLRRSGQGRGGGAGTWKKQVSQGGRPYWSNTVTKESTWIPPSVDREGWVRLTNEEGKLFYYNTATGENAWKLPDDAELVGSDEGPAASEGGGEWQSHVDKSTGKEFWVSTSTGVATWDDPAAGGGGGGSGRSRSPPPNKKSRGSRPQGGGEEARPLLGGEAGGVAGGGAGPGRGRSSHPGPRGWKQYFSRTYNRPYWHNQVTKEQTWVKPTA